MTTMMTNPVVVATPTRPVIAPKARAPQLSAPTKADFGRVRVPAAVVLTLFPVNVLRHSIDGRSVGPCPDHHRRACLFSILSRLLYAFA